MLKFETTQEEAEIIAKIVKRAKSLNNNVDNFTLLMDLSATHSSGCQLRLDELLATDDFNFAHDIFGIMLHIDRETGQLDGFQPRFAA